MIVARTRDDLIRSLAPLRSRGPLALVPTMGGLHEGHLSLVDLATRDAGAVTVSIFVNPLQFGPGEDLATYPRDEARDLRLLRDRGVDLVFVPSDDVMYPDGEPRVTVSAGPLERRLCGASRPGHFRGVLTVVAKLFGLFRPDVAVFGRKDFQQAVLIRRMTRDLELDVDVRLGPIVREPDGLATSSRNVYLGPEERAEAPALHRGLEAARARHVAGERSAAVLIDSVRGEVQPCPRLALEYVEVVDPGSLDPVEDAGIGAIVALAARCGSTRLIDNVELA